MPSDLITRGNLHLWGIRRRSDHFCVISGEAPSACDSTRTSFQSRSAMSVISFPMDASLPTLGRKCNGKFTEDSEPCRVYRFPMADMNDEDRNEEVGIRRRIKTAMRAYREARGFTQKEMAQFLGVSEDNYESYESKPKRAVPTGVIARFCRYTDADVNWIMFGHAAKRSRKVS